MEIAFDTQRLRTLSENTAVATRELGHSAADGLRRRLADLRAAQSVCDLVASPPTQLDDPLELSIPIADGFHLVLRCNHLEAPMLNTGSLDWSSVERVKIMGVERDG